MKMKLLFDLQPVLAQLKAEKATAPDDPRDTVRTLSRLLKEGINLATVKAGVPSTREGDRMYFNFMNALDAMVESGNLELEIERECYDLMKASWLTGSQYLPPVLYGFKESIHLAFDNATEQKTK